MHGLVAKKDLEFQGSFYESYIDTFNFDFKAEFFNLIVVNQIQGTTMAMIPHWSGGGVYHTIPLLEFFFSREICRISLWFSGCWSPCSLLYGPPVSSLQARGFSSDPLCLCLATGGRAPKLRFRPPKQGEAKMMKTRIVRIYLWNNLHMYVWRAMKYIYIQYIYIYIAILCMWLHMYIAQVCTYTHMQNK